MDSRFGTAHTVATMAIGNREDTVGLITKDNRLPYLTSRERNRPLALVIEGRQGRLPQHEPLLHGGISHEDPVVEQWRSFSLHLPMLLWLLATAVAGWLCAIMWHVMPMLLWLAFGSTLGLPWRALRAMERRWYPLNHNGYGEDELGTVQAAVREARASLRGPETISVKEMPERIHVLAVKKENATQRQRGVWRWWRDEKRADINNWNITGD